MITQLEALRKNTIVVADTGDFESIKAFHPRDVTTNPSLILKAIRRDEYKPILEQVVKNAKNLNQVNTITDQLLVEFARRILEIVPGRVSTEIDARLSFDMKKTLDRARNLINLYETSGIPRNRVLIKIAATWEGIQAARALETENIRCNLTLVFSLSQAIACAQANVTLISPFVGRVYDWHKKSMGVHWIEQENLGKKDPGVQIVSEIFRYYKSSGIKTEIMGASFRNLEQILALSGCDLLTIGPEFLIQLNTNIGNVPIQLDQMIKKDNSSSTLEYSEEEFRNQLNSNLMAKEKLLEGINIFIADIVKLESIITDYR